MQNDPKNHRDIWKISGDDPAIRKLDTYVFYLIKYIGRLNIISDRTSSTKTLSVLACLIDRCDDKLIQ